MTKEKNVQILKRLFYKERVIKGQRLLKALGTHSRMTLYRHLLELEYLCSYSHRGMYYTCERGVKFNSNGVWRWEDVYFSRYGTLRATLIELINKSDVGCFQGELRKLVGVPVQDSLLALVQQKKISRKEVEGDYLYVSATKELRERQFKKQREQKPQVYIPKEFVIEILAEIIQASGKALAIDAIRVVKNLHGKGIQVLQAQVEQVIESYGLKKKRVNAD